jgi:CII-binding regulator of phage lambda lysogenization HflD
MQQKTKLSIWKLYPTNSITQDQIQTLIDQTQTTIDTTKSTLTKELQDQIDGINRQIERINTSSLSDMDKTRQTGKYRLEIVELERKLSTIDSNPVMAKLQSRLDLLHTQSSQP